MKKDPDEIAAIEKAISEKYGAEAIQDPRSSWSKEKEEQYIQQVREVAGKMDRTSRSRERVEIDGVFVSRKLLSKERSVRSCPVCESYSFESRDDVYMSKYKCCFECWVQYVDGREQLWKDGWRPE